MSTQRLTEDILAFNGISWEQAKRLGNETRIKLPPTQAEYEAARKSIDQQKQSIMNQIQSSVDASKRSRMDEIKKDLETQKAKIKKSIKDDFVRQIKAIIKQREKETLKRIDDEEQKIIAKIHAERDENIKMLRMASEQRKEINNLLASGAKLKSEINEISDKIDHNETQQLLKNIEKLKIIEQLLKDKIKSLNPKQAENDTESALKSKQTFKNPEQEFDYLNKSVKNLLKEYESKKEKDDVNEAAKAWKNNGIIVDDSDDKNPIRLIADVTGNTEDLRYEFSYIKEGSSKKVIINRYDDETMRCFSPKESGKYTILLTVYDERGNKKISKITYDVKSTQIVKDIQPQDTKSKISKDKIKPTQKIAHEKKETSASSPSLSTTATLSSTGEKKKKPQSTTATSSKAVENKPQSTTVTSSKVVEKKPKITTVDDIVRFDSANTKYAKHVKNILKNIDSMDFKYAENSDRSLENLSAKICNVCRKISQKFNIKLHPVQIMTVLRLSDDILNSHGSIAQVKTGEGKSLIIAVLGIVLSQYDHKIDVVTSSDELARRDQENQKKYYDLFNISSGVLYRKTPNQDSVKSDVSESNSFNLDSLINTIVYSTNSNFEFVFLHSVFRKDPLRTRPYDVVIVDEIDNMLLDQAMSPAIIANSLPVKNAQAIFETVYKHKKGDFNNLINSVELKALFQNDEIPISTIRMMFEAAQRSQHFVKDKDYIVRGNEVIIIDPSTGYIKPASRWQNFIHEMMEIKEGLPVKEPSVSTCLITQKAFFNMYNKITGLTGTVGNDENVTLLTKTYNTKVFRMPRNLPSQQTVISQKRSDNIDEVFGQLNLEVNEQHAKGRPILMIMPSKNLVDAFCQKYFPKAKTIKGVDMPEDRNAISNAGRTGAITVATNAAGRGVDISLSPRALGLGGLYVIIPFMPENQRILEQAMGRAARQGQPGTVSIYVSNTDHFFPTTDFNPNYEKLLELQARFASYIKENWPWMYKYENNFNVLKDPIQIGATAPDILKKSTREMASTIPVFVNLNEEIFDKILSSTILNMILTSWGVFFTDLSENIESFDNFSEIDKEYEDFLADLHNYIPKNCANCGEMTRHIVINASLEMLDELAGKILDFTSQILDSALPDGVKEVLQNRAVSDIIKVSGGVAGIATGTAACATGVGIIVGLPAILLSVATASEGLLDLWNFINGNEEEGQNFLKEITGHKVDNLLDLGEIITTAASAGVAKSAGKSASQAAGKGTSQSAFSKESSKLKESLKKARGLSTKVNEEMRIAVRNARRELRDRLKRIKGRPKKIGKPVNIEKILDEQGMAPIFDSKSKPNIQLFAEKKIASVSQMQAQINKEQAPRDVIRVDRPHNPNVPNQKPHVHFSDGTSMNIDGTVHDVHRGIPNPSKDTIKWLQKNGWGV